MKISTIILVAIACLFYACGSGLKKQSTGDAGQEKSYILYVGTYTEQEAHVDGKAEGIYVFRMNAETGKLKQVSKSPFTVNPSYLTVSKDGNYLYVVNETGDDEIGHVSAFRIIDENLEFINKVSSEGDYPCYIEVDPHGRFTLTANYGSGNVALLPIERDGSLRPAASVDQHTGKGPTASQMSAHAHFIAYSDDGKFIYSNDLGTDRIYIYRYDDNKLELTGMWTATPGSGPRHLAFHPFLNVAYSINELNGTIDCLVRDTITGGLDHFQSVSAVPDSNSNDASSADIHVTPSGEFLYATNRGNYNNIAAFRIDTVTGRLHLIGFYSVKGETPRNFVIDPEGRFLLVANQNSDSIIVFSIDPETGVLKDTGIEVRVPTPVCLKFHPKV